MLGHRPVERRHFGDEELALDFLGTVGHRDLLAQCDAMPEAPARLYEPDHSAGPGKVTGSREGPFIAARREARGEVRMSAELLSAAPAPSFRPYAMLRTVCIPMTALIRTPSKTKRLQTAPSAKILP
ncbi:hypothetical protein GCM10011326_31950 [Salipiger profundus]|nr:hypothetical protein GCM10011326_31950 [Salipiger profundus]